MNSVSYFIYCLMTAFDLEPYITLCLLWVAVCGLSWLIYATVKNKDAKYRSLKCAVLSFFLIGFAGLFLSSCFVMTYYSTTQKVVAELQKNAERGNAQAQFNLGDCYSKGIGVPLDFEKAVYWFTKSAEQGCASAQHRLGLCYYNGEGVPKNLEKAGYWLRKVEAYLTPVQKAVLLNNLP